MLTLLLRFLVFSQVAVSLIPAFFVPQGNQHARFHGEQQRGRTLFQATDESSLEASINTSFMWNAGLNFGNGQFKFYNDFDDWMNAFPDEDRQAYPELFNFPKGAYEVKLTKPLGIVFEEIDAGRGLYVKELVEGGAAARLGTIQPDDILVGITAVKIVGAKWERRLIPSKKFDFDTMVGAIESNNPKFGCNDVVLVFERPSESDSVKVDKFMEFFEPPFDNP